MARGELYAQPPNPHRCALKCPVGDYYGKSPVTPENTGLLGEHFVQIKRVTLKECLAARCRRAADGNTAERTVQLRRLPVTPFSADRHCANFTEGFKVMAHPN